MTRAGRAHARPAALLALLLLALLLLSACGGDEDSATPSRPIASTPASNGDQEPAPPTADGDADGDDSRFGASLETAGETLVDTLENATSFSVDGTTLTLVFDDGSAGFDGSIDCLSAGGLLQDGETLVLEYPDGSTEC